MFRLFALVRSTGSMATMSFGDSPSEEMSSRSRGFPGSWMMAGWLRVLSSVSCHEKTAWMLDGVRNQLLSEKGAEDLRFADC